MLKRSIASGDLKLHNSDSSPRATYFCVDIEANGPVPGLYDMVSIGIVVVTPTQEGTLKVGETLYIEFRPQAPRFDAQAAAIHGLIKTDFIKKRREKPVVKSLLGATQNPRNTPSICRTQCSL